MTRKTILGKVRRLVLKVGSRVLTAKGRILSQVVFDRLAREISAAKKKLPEVRRFFSRINQKIYPISALTGKGLPELLGVLVKQLPPRWKEEKGS